MDDKASPESSLSHKTYTLHATSKEGGSDIGNSQTMSSYTAITHVFSSSEDETPEKA